MGGNFSTSNVDFLVMLHVQPCIVRNIKLLMNSNLKNKMLTPVKFMYYCKDLYIAIRYLAIAMYRIVGKFCV